MSIESLAPQWLWMAFIAGVVCLLLLDLFVFHRKAHAVSIREALLVSAGWISLALAFNLWLGYTYGTEPGLEFLTGYLIEKSLSVDNLFVILLVFGAFRIPSEYQHKVLFWGILGAVVMRGTLIVVGAQLIHSFHWIIYIFGGILLLSALKLLRESDEEKDVTHHWAVRLIQKAVPVTGKLHGQKFTVIENGVRKITPLFLALVVIEATDLVFAVDSIPAVFAVTDDAFIAFSSNILALLGLRALYFVIADWVARFRYLKPGLAAVLAFVGAKMLLADVFKVPSWVSLGIITLILAGAAIASYLADKRDHASASKRTT